MSLKTKFNVLLVITMFLLLLSGFYMTRITSLQQELDTLKDKQRADITRVISEMRQVGG